MLAKTLAKNVALPIVCGGAAAWVVASLMRAPQNLTPPAKQEEAASATPPPGAPDLAHLNARLAKLERDNAARTLSEGDSGQLGFESTEQPPPADPEQRREWRKELALSLSTRFERDVPDPSWAPGAERGLEDDIAKLDTTLGVSARQVRCKSRYCYAELDAKDLESGRAAAKELMHGAFSKSCERTVVALSENEEGPISLAVGLDCQEAHATR